MPVKPEHRWPIDWPQLSAMIRFQRAKGRCECGRPHGQMVLLGDGHWWNAESNTRANVRGCALRHVEVLLRRAPVDPPPDAKLVAVKAAARERERSLFIFCFEPSLAWRAAINWTSLNAVCCFHD